MFSLTCTTERLHPINDRYNNIKVIKVNLIFSTLKKCVHKNGTSSPGSSAFVSEEYESNWIFD